VIASFGQASTQKSQKILCRAKAAQRLQSRGRPAASGLSRPVWTPAGTITGSFNDGFDLKHGFVRASGERLYKLIGRWAFGV